MISIPMQVDDLRYDLFVILEQENIDRMKEYDPAEIVTKNIGLPWSKMSIRNIQLMWASPEEIKHLTSLRSMKDVLPALKNLARGWKYRPEKGDSDQDYQRMQQQ